MPKLVNADKVAEAIDWLNEYDFVLWNEIMKCIDKVPEVDAVPVIRCKDCKYFHYDKVYNIQGFPIMGNSVCDKWANGCQTDENGYCFLGERREDEQLER